MKITSPVSDIRNFQFRCLALNNSVVSGARLTKLGRYPAINEGLLSQVSDRSYLVGERRYRHTKALM